MNGGEKERRQRAVRLTDEGVELLMGRLQKVAQRSSPEVRLTRASRATFMGVSIGTAARILGQKGNDKMLLVQVFDSLGLTWDDRYCEVKPLDNEEPLTETLQEREPEALPAPPIPRRRKFTGVLVAMSVVAPLAGLLWVKTMGSQPVAQADTEPSAHTKLDASRAAYLRGDYQEAERLASEAVEQAKTTTPSAKLAYALSLEGDILAAGGRLDEAIVRYKQALPFWDVLGKAQGYGALLESLGIAEARLGRLAEAQGHFEEGLKHREAINDSGVEAGLLRDLGNVAAVRGDLAGARRKYQEASLVIAHRPEELMHVDLKALQALLLRDEGKFDEALAELQQCLRVWQEQGQARWIGTTLFQIATVHLAAGNLEQAEVAFRTAKPYFEKVSDARGVQECSKGITGSTAPDLMRRVEEFF